MTSAPYSYASVTRGYQARFLAFRALRASAPLRFGLVQSLTPSISAACRRVVSVIFTPPSIRASSSTRSRTLQRPHVAAHLAGDLGLAHLPLPVGRRRHLRQMGDAHDLMAAPKLLQHPAHDLRHPAADPGVHFVEHQRRHLRDLGGDGLDRQAEPRQLTAGGDLGQRPDRRTRVRGGQELDSLETVRAARLDRRRAQSRSARPPWPGLASARSRAGRAPRRPARALATAAARPAGRPARPRAPCA